MGGRFMPAYYHELVGQADSESQGHSEGFPVDAEGVVAKTAALDPAEVELFAFKSSWDVVKICDR